MKLNKMLSIMVGGPVSNGIRFSRNDAIAALMSKGFAERTAVNHLTPSRANETLGRLMKIGAVERDGPFVYKVIDAAAITESDAAIRRRSVRKFMGEEREGWKYMGIVSDKSAHEVAWKLCGVEFSPGKFNLKLYADGMVPHKANYWLRSNSGKLVKDRSSAILKLHHPDLYANIEEDLTEV